MGVRLKSVLVILGSIAIVLAIVVFRQSEENPASDSSTDDLFAGGIGIVGALTATAGAGGGGVAFVVSEPDLPRAERFWPVAGLALGATSASTPSRRAVSAPRVALTSTPMTALA